MVLDTPLPAPADSSKLEAGRITLELVEGGRVHVFALIAGSQAGDPTTVLLLRKVWEAGAATRGARTSRRQGPLPAAPRLGRVPALPAVPPCYLRRSRRPDPDLVDLEELVASGRVRVCEPPRALSSRLVAERGDRAAVLRLEPAEGLRSVREVAEVAVALVVRALLSVAVGRGAVPRIGLWRRTAVGDALRVEPPTVRTGVLVRPVGGTLRVVVRVETRGLDGPDELVPVLTRLPVVEDTGTREAVAG